MEPRVSPTVSHKRVQGDKARRLRRSSNGEEENRGGGVLEAQGRKIFQEGGMTIVSNAAKRFIKT